MLTKFLGFSVFLSVVTLGFSGFYSAYAQVKVEPHPPTTTKPGTVALKSLSKARVLSAICPGAGQFYIRNYRKGVMDFGIESILVGGTILSLNARGRAPENAPERENYTWLAVLCGVGAVGYYIFQIWRLNDDVVVYNYKKRFLESTSLKFNFNPTKYSFSLLFTI